MLTLPRHFSPTLPSGEVEKELEKFVELFDVSFAIIVCTLKYIIVDCEAQRKE